MVVCWQKQINSHQSNRL